MIERRGSAEELVAPKDPSSRLAVLCFPTSPAVVAGSTQPLESLDLSAIAAHGAEVVRRRSGGGAVYVAPGEQVWLDLYLPATDPLHEVDVARAAAFVGDLWRRALAEFVPRDSSLAVYSGPLISSRWSRTWCYLGLGPGEVTFDDQKLIGLSQRRNRKGTWFFTMGYFALDSTRDAEFISLSDVERKEFAAELRDTIVALPAEQDTVLEALRLALATA